MRIAGQRVVVIGGTSGIGFAVADAVVQAGASVAIASSSQQNVDDALSRLTADARGYRVDVRDEDSVQGFFKEVGTFDHIVYTAGDYLLFKELKDITMSEARDSFNTRYWGAFMVAKYGLNGICADGSLVLTSGIIATRPVPGLAAAASATSAVESLTRALALELAPIRVNVVRLGPVGRKPQEGAEEHQRELYKSISEKLPIKRMGESSEAASAYLYLMENGFSTGSVLITDGGFTLV